MSVAVAIVELFGRRAGFDEGGLDAEGRQSIVELPQEQRMRR